MPPRPEPRLLALPAPEAGSVLGGLQAARLQHAYTLPAAPAWAPPQASSSVLADPSRWERDGACPFCAAPLALPAEACERCGAPLLPPLQAAGLREARAGRRAAPRLARHDDRAQLLLPGAAQTVAVRVRDLSLTGIGLEVPWAVREGSPARVLGGAFDGVIQVLRCRREDGHHRLHGQWLTMRLLQRAGAFVSARA